MGAAKGMFRLAKRHIYGAWMACLWLLSMPLFAQSYDEKARLLMREGDGLTLKRLVDEHRDSLSKGICAISNAFIRGCQGDAKRGAKMMKRALKHGEELTNDTLLAQLTFGIALQQHRCRHEKQAAKTLSRFLSCHESFPMKTVFEQYQQLFQAYRTYKQRWKGGKKAVIPFRLDSVGATGERSVAVMLLAEVNGHSSDFMLDTGATMNVVSRSVAERLGLKQTNVPIFLDGMGKNCGWLAVAESVRIGNMKGENVAFCVIEDEHKEVSAPDVAHQKAIIGLPLLQEIGCVELDFKNRKMHACEDIQMDEPNLSCGFAENGLQLEVRHHGNRLQMIPDMGATHSAVSTSQLSGQQHYVSDYLPSREVQFIGWGGTIAGHEYLYPQFDIAVGRTVVTIPQMSVFDHPDYDSRLGMDFFSRCERVVFHLRYPAGMSVISWR